MKALPENLLKEYLGNPLAADEKVRKHCNLPEDKYYVVSVWPNPGIVRITNVSRTVKGKKISKSDQRT